MTTVAMPAKRGRGSPLRKATVRSVEQRNALVADNLSLIGYAIAPVLRRFRAVRADERTFAFDEGTFALIRAAELWEEGRGIAFSTYAVVSVRLHVARQMKHRLETKIRERRMIDDYARRPEATRLYADGTNPEREAIRREDVAGLHAAVAIAPLTTRERDAVTLALAGIDSPKEASSLLGVAPSRYSHLLVLARKKLRKILLAKEGKGVS